MDMTREHGVRSTREKIAIFRACFSGLDHVYGTYDPATGRARQVKEPVTDWVILRHLTGQRPFGVYLLVQDRTRALAVDFDSEDHGPPRALVSVAGELGIQAYIERSKSKGYHAWAFFEKSGVLAAHARRVAQLILDRIGLPNTEVFPKQDRLGHATQYGNFINAPLFGNLVPQGRTVFVDPVTLSQPYADQWALLASVRRVSGTRLSEIAESTAVGESEEPQRTRPRAVRGGNGTPSQTFGLPPCAQRMLAKGVEHYQRVACFRLAVHLRKAGLPLDFARVCLEKWAAKNRPRDGKSRITRTEIAEQAVCAYQKDYRGCGCEDPAIRPYCHPECPLKVRATQT